MTSYFCLCLLLLITESLLLGYGASSGAPVTSYRHYRYLRNLGNAFPLAKENNRRNAATSQLVKGADLKLLSSGTMQRIFSNVLSAKRSQRIFEIGGYFNGISNLLVHCPEYVVLVDPLLDTGVSYKNCSGGAFPVFAFAMLAEEIPLSFSTEFLNQLDAVVCVSCGVGSNLSPELMSHFKEAHILVEYAVNYLPSSATCSKVGKNILYDHVLSVEDSNFTYRRMMIYGSTHHRDLNLIRSNISFKLPSPNECSKNHSRESHKSTYKSQALLAESVFDKVRPAVHPYLCPTDPALLLSSYFKHAVPRSVRAIYKLWTYKRVRDCSKVTKSSCPLSDVPTLTCVSWIGEVAKIMVSLGDKVVFCRSQIASALRTLSAKCASTLAADSLLIVYSLTLSLEQCFTNVSEATWRSLHKALAGYAQGSECDIQQRIVPQLYSFITPPPKRPVPQHLIRMLEPLCVSGRNIMHWLTGTLIDFSPYLHLPFIIQSANMSRFYLGKSAVLWDLGSNGFYASAKSLIDMYSPYLNFRSIYVVDPDNFYIPKAYRSRLNIVKNIGRFHLQNTSSSTHGAWNVFSILDSIEQCDYVVIKLDIDDGTVGSTIEWGMLVEIIEALSERDLFVELFVELHMFNPAYHWDHYKHSMWEAFDFLRHLRQQGYAVHAWP